MLIVPVIDIRHGVAVSAMRGERAAYQPLQSPLAKSCAPLDVADGFLALYPFPILYVADLDGIEGRGANLDAVRRLKERHPEIELWLDCGAADPQACDACREVGAVPVLGSESQREAHLARRLAAEDPGSFVLSLDFRGEDLVGPPEFLREPDLWPARLVVMTLARIGSSQGPDIGRVQAIRSAAGPDRAIYAAGGIRNADDLLALGRAGAAGALVATAFHRGAIDADDLGRLAAGGPRRPT